MNTHNLYLSKNIDQIMTMTEVLNNFKLFNNDKRRFILSPLPPLVNQTFNSFR